MGFRLLSDILLLLARDGVRTFSLVFNVQPEPDICVSRTGLPSFVVSRLFSIVFTGSVLRSSKVMRIVVALNLSNKVSMALSVSAFFFAVSSFFSESY